jgi:hypothetical protein
LLLLLLLLVARTQPRQVSSFFAKKSIGTLLWKETPSIFMAPLPLEAIVEEPSPASMLSSSPSSSPALPLAAEAKEEDDEGLALFIGDGGATVVARSASN